MACEKEKASVDEIRRRFDADVERFANLETGQTSTVDAALAMRLACDAAARTTPRATALLDIGCGAGNYSLSLLQRLPALDVTLLDLSAAMLNRAHQRVSSATSGKVATLQSDIREAQFSPESFDIIVASASLHHLRADEEYQTVFKKCFAALRPGGSFWIVDLVTHEIPAVQNLLWERYGEYLSALKGDQSRDAIFAYIEREDTPRPVSSQLVWLRAAGFSSADILHKNTCFATFGAVKI